MKLFTDFKIRRIAAIALLSLEAIFLTLFFFLGVKGGNAFAIFGANELEVATGTKIIHGLVLGITVINLLLVVRGLATEIYKKRSLGNEISNAVVSLLLMILAANNKIYNLVFVIFALIIAIALLAYQLYFFYRNKDAEPVTKMPLKKEELRASIITLVVLTLSLFASFLIFLIPVCYYANKPYFTLFEALKENASLTNLISFVGFFVIFVAEIVYFSHIIAYYKNDAQKFYKKARKGLYASFALTVAFYVFAIVIQYVFTKEVKTELVDEGIIFDDEPLSTFSTAYIPIIINAIVVVINAIFVSKFIGNKEKKKDPKFLNRTVALAFTLAFIGLLVGALFSNIIVINFETDFELTVVKINGFTMLKNFHDIHKAEYQAFALLVYFLLVAIVIMATTTISLYIRRSKFFYKTSFICVIASFLSIVCIALFGKYYQIAERINNATLMEILDYYGADITFEYTTKVTSQTIYFAAGALVLLVALIFARPFSKYLKDEGIDVNINSDEFGALAPAGGGAPLGREDVSDARSRDFDACPAFSEIDSEEEEILLDVEQRRQAAFKNASLPTIVRFIVEYAKESRLHLSYKESEIAQFIAGLGSSKLSILQGMSGTGKTSLPKIFAEAIFGNAYIVEVESSWKDKNELVGYYNEFSGKFTPKKFAQALYRSKFTPDVITFIVLDEMNLSRIEYYFSDFLSLMENEEDKREFKLLNVQLKNIKHGQNLSYKQLIKGHTLKVPTNVWFIGTANRDESTFEISDKVYDRAMTMNFSARADKIKAFNEPIDKRFLDYNVFKKLIDDAVKSFYFDASTSPTIKEVEALLRPYNISFGNRVEKQIETFVSVYCSCFTEPRKMVDEAIEKILLSKVVAKLEFKSVENKEELAHAFEKLGLMECASFIINKINEDF